MSTLRERTEDEKAQWQLGRDENEFYADEEESFHSYDSVSYNRASGGDQNFITVPVQPGEYTVILTYDGQEFVQNAVIFPDYWSDK